MTERGRFRLSADGHVHSQWSWDAPNASMERACELAVELRLPSIAFTEHVDFAPRSLSRGVPVPAWQRPLVADGVFAPPRFDAAGYLACLARCRERFPGLAILSGAELGEPHLRCRQVDETLRGIRFDRVLASVHTLPSSAGERTTVDAAYETARPDAVVRAYLREVQMVVEDFDGFDVLAHVDYAARYWPNDLEPFRASRFREEYLAVLTALAARGKALEINTRIPPNPNILRWWHDVKGPAVAFGSDAHRPEQIARGFADAAALAEATGFVPTRNPHDLWGRH